MGLERAFGKATQVRKDLREITDWKKGEILLGVEEVENRIKELMKEARTRNYSVLIYGIVKTAVVRAMYETDEAIKEMMKGD